LLSAFKQANGSLSGKYLVCAHAPNQALHPTKNRDAVFVG